MATEGPLLRPGSTSFCCLSEATGGNKRQLCSCNLQRIFPLTLAIKHMCKDVLNNSEAAEARASVIHKTALEAPKKRMESRRYCPSADFESFVVSGGAPSC